MPGGTLNAFLSRQKVTSRKLLVRLQGASYKSCLPLPGVMFTLPPPPSP